MNKVARHDERLCKRLRIGEGIGGSSGIFERKVEDAGPIKGIGKFAGEVAGMSEGMGELTGTLDVEGTGMSKVEVEGVLVGLSRTVGARSSHQLYWLRALQPQAPANISGIWSPMRLIWLPSK